MTNLAGQPFCRVDVAENARLSGQFPRQNPDNPAAGRPAVQRQLLFAGWRRLFLPVHLLFLTLLLRHSGSVAGHVKLQDYGVVGPPGPIAAAVAMGLAKMRSHSEKTRLEVMPNDLRS